MLDVFERGEDEFNNDELEARLEVRTTTRWSRRGALATTHSKGWRNSAAHSSTTIIKG